MTDRYHGGYVGPGRSSTFNNPARTSMPSSIGYSSLYAGDMHVMPSSTRHATTAPRGHTTSTTTSGVPTTTTRTYAVTRDPRSGPTVAREPSRTRRSTLDSSSRPPVIVTTTQAQAQADRQANHSPVRNPSRTSDGHLYTQPASTIRSRSTAPSHGHRHSGSEDHTRGRDRERERERERNDADAYRSSRPTVIYTNDPRHSSAVVDYGDDGYQYTNAGELARYDLDHSGPRSRRMDSFDRGYHRPNVSYNPDQRTFSVNTSGDLSRNYTMNTSRPYDGPSRGGPPPSTRGFDRINGSFDSVRDVPPSAPVPPSPTLVVPRSSEPAVGSLDREGRRSRPVSLYQEAPPRSSHHDDYHRSRENERNMRELRDRERESQRPHEPSRFHDESVTTRGFGIRTGPVDDQEDRRERRRESWRDEPRKRSDEDVIIRETELEAERRRRNRVDEKDEPRKRSDEEVVRESDADRERRRRSRPDERVEPRKHSDESLHRESDLDRERRRRGRPDEKDDRRERRESRRGSDEDRSRLRDKIISGVGVAAAAVGLGSAVKDDTRDKNESERDDRERSDRDREKADKEPRRRRSPTEDADVRDQPEKGRSNPEDRERRRERSKSRDREYDRQRPAAREESDRKERIRRDAESRLNGDPTGSGSDSEAKKPRPALTFNPNDASDISKLREQLASMNTPDKEKERVPIAREQPKEPSARSSAASDLPRREPPPRSEPPTADHRKSASQSPPRHDSLDSGKEESRGRELELAQTEGKAVRVVSPPREKKEEKPLKGILKQPKVSFPEEDSYTREGVAPHKGDKKSADVPPGAKWTKISRKVVNPEALTVGKERFEVRDDFVIVLRVLDKEEIQAYAAATQVLRERRRARVNDEQNEPEQDDDRYRDDDHRRHQRRTRDEDYETDDQERDRDREKDRDYERRRRHRRDDDDDDYDRRSRAETEHHSHHHQRAHRPTAET